ncbi:putative membrane protein, partial [Bordetella bronchiseptica MO211]
MLRLIRLVDRL